MFVRHEAEFPWDGGRGSGPQQPPDPLPPHLRDLLWCLRRTAMLRPLGQGRDAHVHLLLQRGFGDGGLGLEHLLRCLVVGLARRATRPIHLHQPCRPQISDDEWRLLTGLAEAARPDRVAAVLAPLVGSRGAELAPVLAGIAALLPR
ncbi:hypothetical protein CHU93_08190 [Sandarakinorhabdus cyanobacteriorum]|uniref:Uncharacterized protein n=1 Tax=Sandarakinorhabdus cyanobacteriorum TaxID=1981098 RepID=A0A255YJ91_9SPHN|nr:hypothetical protein [Sandarakinorhabdus cyanobacteriorum]OYQ29306.1 hypothetical protein CHU93_08190 [Sandarakinorhabdus cyanobacteriorum]